MAEELIEIILQAVDNASSIFSSVSSSAEEIGTTMTEVGEEASSSFDEIDESATGATGSIQDVIDYCQGIDGSGPRDAASGMDELESATDTADTAVEDLGNDLNIINAGMLLQTAEQISAIAGNAEGMAQEMNTAAISVGQLATQTGIAEPQMVSLVNTISNATFPNDEAMMYIKSLDQMGVASENLGASATNIDRINDAFGLGAQKTNSLAQELGVLGVDMNNVSSSFNALAYANANTVGGMENYYTFLRKYDAQFKELGYNVDQASVIIAAATQKFGGGRAALTGLSDALKTANGDTRALEQALGMQAGSIENASQLTGQYEGQLQALADEEAEHKTLLDQLGAAWEDVSLSLSGILSPLGSAVGLIGEVGSFGMQINGLKMLGGTLKTVVSGIKDFNLAKTIQNVLEGEGAIASIAGALGITTEAAAAEGATVAFGGLAIAEGAALWPILAIIAAIALFVVAVYEIGKAFGWWKDVGTMFEAIKAGIMKMWEAFINHPDVQAVISAITTAWNALVSAIGAVIGAIGEFFGIANTGEFDIVAVLIEGIGLAWEALTFPLHSVIGLMQLLYPIMESFFNNNLVPFGEFLVGVFTPVWNLLMSVFSAIMPYVTNLTNAFTQFANGQMTLPSLIMAVLTSLWNIYTTILTRIVTAVLNWGRQIVSNAISAVTSFVNNIMTRIQQLPGRVLSALLQVVSSIVAAGVQWVSNARSQASSIVSGVVGILSGLPGQISSALSGVVNAIVSPFRSAYDSVVGIVNNLKNQVQEGLNYIGQLGNGAAGGEIIAAGGESLDVYGNRFDIRTGRSTDKLDVEVNERIVLDFANVPAHIDTDTLAEAIQDRDVLKALTTNRTFQDLDANIKSRIEARNNRSRGV